jgi:hypothetical protein
VDKLAASQKGSAFDTLLWGKNYFAAPRHYHSHIYFCADSNLYYFKGYRPAKITRGRNYAQMK